MRAAKVSIIVPRSSWTFRLLPGETHDQAVNRFQFALLDDEDKLRSFAEVVIREAFANSGKDEPNAYWVEKVPRFISDEEIGKKFRFHDRSA